MNILPPLTRICAHQTVSFRSIPTKSLRQTQTQLRHLSSTTQVTAQPISLSSTTTPASPSESSTLTSDVLSRASTDPTQPQTTTTSSSQSAHPPPSQTTSTLSSTTSASPFLLLGTVSRTGTMTSTVQITSKSQIFDPFLQKHYTRPSRLLAHDPNPSGFLREGDVVEYGLFSPQEKQAKEDKRLELEGRLLEKGVIRLRTRRGKEKSLREVGVKRRGLRWVVRRVVSGFGVGVDERLGELEREQERVRELGAEVKAEVKGKGQAKGKGKATLASKGGSVRKQHRSAAVAG